MPASRWHSSISDLYQWMGEGEDELWSMLMPSMLPRPARNSDPSEPETGSDPEAPKYPKVLPILPLRGIVVYPETAEVGS